MPMFKKGKKDSGKDKDAEQSAAPAAEADAQSTEEPEGAPSAPSGAAAAGSSSVAASGDGAAVDPPKAEPDKASDDDDDLEADILDLFTDDDGINEELSNITSGLDDVDINDLLEQVRDLGNIIGRRAA